MESKISTTAPLYQKQACSVQTAALQIEIR